MKHEVVKSEITVIGGGLAGLCAAIAAARLGRTVSLVHNRPVLGGNSSSEVRVWVCGATGHGVNRYARETGIMGELFLENQYRNPEGNPYLWDLTLLEAVRAEPNITLYLNTDVREVEADGDLQNRIIRSVTGWMMGSERLIRFESSVFLDCSGDGLVGFLAGAAYRLGREARHEHDEDWAPDVADDITLGSTLLFYTKDTGKPVRFVPPTFAKDITTTTIPVKRVIRSGDNGCHYWWIEWGGELDTVHNNERIRDELWSVIYGIWDYIKNSGKFEAETMTLEWVGSLPGKREYRRFIGDYVLNQNDIIAQRPFDDRVAFGGWSIDLHPPQGMYAKESGSKHLHADGIYHIPFGSLYSRNVSNLLFAGRDISATHVAFGTTRVMATCAVIGEAAGTGAALCVSKGVTPRELRERHMAELQQEMIKRDASIIGLAGRDPEDVASLADIRTSSTLSRIRVDQAAAPYPLTSDVGILFPVEGPIGELELLVSASEDTRLQVELWDTGRPENYVPAAQRRQADVSVAKGEMQWITLPLDWDASSEPCNAFLIVRKNERISLHESTVPVTGVLTFDRGLKPVVSSDLEDHQPDQPVLEWTMKKRVRRPFCFAADTGALSPDKVVDGFVRAYGGPHMWVSEPMQPGRAEWLELEWKKPVEVIEIHLTFNDDVNEDLINLHHHETPFRIIPELVKDYDLETWLDGSWVVIASARGNRKRKRVHRLGNAITAAKLRLVVHSANGCERAEVVEIRVYSRREHLP